MKYNTKLKKPKRVIGEGDGTPLQYSCLENPMDGGAWWAAVHGIAEGWTQLSDFTFTFHFHALEKEMPTHSSVLAWRIPGTGEPAGMLSMGSHIFGGFTDNNRLLLKCVQAYCLAMGGIKWLLCTWLVLEAIAFNFRSHFLLTGI